MPKESTGSKGELVIDVFNHVFPDEYVEALPKPNQYIADWCEKAPGFRNMDYRIKRMDKLGITMQVLSLARPWYDNIRDSHDITRVMRAANDGIARIVEKHPGRFAGIATISLADVGGAIEELDRCVRDKGLLGVQILSNVDSRPLDSAELDPFYGKLAQLDAALWIHPTDMGKTYDWLNEYALNLILGWCIDSSLAMYRIVRGGVFERHPRLKVITHHMGVLIPFLAERIDRMMMLQGKNGKPPAPLTKRPLQCFKSFYVDTAEGSWKPALTCSHMYFGSNRILYASDYPFTGEDHPKKIIRTLMELEATEDEKRKMLGLNAKHLFKIS